MFCREQVARYNERLDEFADLGATICAIGNGTAVMARDFAETFDVRFSLYTDPSRETYRVVGFKRGLGLSLGLVKSSVRALRSGHLQGRTKGDPLQQGGVVAVDSGGTILYSYVNNDAGDHADIDQVLAALRDPARQPE